ncbi:uncharacterized protein LOC110722498 [Chenopodium quinoa]|uniref:uncharacterized protein LOC110722498 n=1 Tax=Chenopodium quinoa TaxID=63459 RepID=UPI000B76F84A|nr:uncharacterized protein LOC110722498 [Chenopodium quinoa]
MPNLQDNMSSYHPRDPKRLLFKEKQESARKDVERAFGVLQSRFAIVRGPAHERHTYNKNFPNDEFSPSVVDDVHQGHEENFESYLERDATIRDRQMHHQLKADLVEHIWSRFGSYNLN